MPVTDRALVANVRGGDADAFRALVDRHGRMLFRVAYRVTANQQDAEDVVQETFLRAHRELHRFELRASVGTWLYRIAVNTAVDVLRSRRRETDWPVGQDERVTSTAPLPDRALLSSEIQERIEAALEPLSAQERAAFVLRHFEGLSTAEIGDLLGLGISAAKHSVFRAVKKVRAALEPLLDR